VSTLPHCGTSPAGPAKRLAPEGDNPAHSQRRGYLGRFLAGVYATQAAAT